MVGDRSLTSEMARYQVILSYDGTEFQGFQRQSKARTVQQVVETALQGLNWQGKAVLAAGRTDAGVHAYGQVIAFDLDWRHTPEELQRALNAHLPADVVARRVCSVPADFHPRFDAVSRCYHYCIFADQVRDPLRERYAWRIWPEVDFETMQQTARCLPGHHDFAAFGTPPRTKGSTVRTVFRADWEQYSSLGGVPVLVFTIIADAFLYHMVRHLVSLQVEIGQGIKGLDVMEKYLSGETAILVQGLAPSNGLILAEVVYRRE
jgi:tRNA pseudouridine38-40 synthase